MLLPTIPQEDWRWAVTPIDSGTNEICVKQEEKSARPIHAICGSDWVDEQTGEVEEGYTSRRLCGSFKSR